MSRSTEIEIRGPQGPAFARSRRNRNGKAVPASDRDLRARLLKTTAGIIAQCENPAQVLELYYWSRQPGLAAFVRTFLALPHATRKMLAGFLTEGPDPRLISVITKKNRRLILLRPPTARRKGG